MPQELLAYMVIFITWLTKGTNGTAITNGRIPPRIDSLANNIVLSVPINTQ
jgi:hypothetical protein